MKTKMTQRLTPLARRIQVLEAGIRKEIEGKTMVLVSGIAMTSAQLLVRLGELERLYAAARAAPTPEAQAEALALCHDFVWGLKRFIRNLEAALKDHFGVNSPKLLAFGISTAKGKMGRRKALRRAYAAAVTRQARAQTKRAQEPTARTLSEAVQLVRGTPERGPGLYLPWIIPSNPKPGSEE
jgi:hypothetical protein